MIYCGRSAEVDHEVLTISGLRMGENLSTKMKAAILEDLQTLAEDHGDKPREFIKTRRGDKLKQEHMKFALSGAMFSGVRAVDIELVDDIWEGTLQGSLAYHLELDREKIVIKEFYRPSHLPVMLLLLIFKSSCWR